MGVGKPAVSRCVSVLLATGWGFAAVAFVATYLLAGFYGWAAIFVWSLLGAPLGWATERLLIARAQPLEAACRTLALRAWTLLAVGSIVAGLGPWLLAPYQTPILATITVMVIWSALVGQIAFVAFTTGWTTRQLLTRAPATGP